MLLCLQLHAWLGGMLCISWLATTYLVGDSYAGEEVADDVAEQLHVGDQELGQVAVPHGPDQHNVLRQVWVGALQAAGHHQHTLQGAHAKVVVVLHIGLRVGPIARIVQVSAAQTS